MSKQIVDDMMEDFRLKLERLEKEYEPFGEAHKKAWIQNALLRGSPPSVEKRENVPSISSGRRGSAAREKLVSLAPGEVTTFSKASADEVKQVRWVAAYLARQHKYRFATRTIDGDLVVTRKFEGEA